jgi:hypothetical protein
VKIEELSTIHPMKNFLPAFLILIFMLPAFGPWMPHSALQALHVQQERHHGDSGDHHGHSHDLGAEADHPVLFNVLTYFSDYLHVDLKSADHADLKKPVLATQELDFMQLAVLIPPAYAPSSDIQITGLPLESGRLTRPGLPVYLATQRLRI